MNASAEAMNEIQHFVVMNDTRGFGVTEQRVLEFARRRVPLNMLHYVIETMVSTGMLHLRGVDKNTGFKHYTARPASD